MKSYQRSSETMISQSVCPPDWVDRLACPTACTRTSIITAWCVHAHLHSRSRVYKLKRSFETRSWQHYLIFSVASAGFWPWKQYPSRSYLMRGWQLPVFQQVANGSKWDTEWQALRCVQTNLHSFTWNLFDICLLLASHKHIFAYSNNAKEAPLWDYLSLERSFF